MTQHHVPQHYGPVVLGIYDQPIDGFKIASHDDIHTLENDYMVVPANEWYTNTRYFPQDSILSKLPKEQISRYHHSYIEVIRDGRVEYVPRDFSKLQL